MEGTVYFLSIRKEITNCLWQANHIIKVALAWLTDEDLIRVLTKQQEKGINVQIIISNSEENFRNTEKFREFLQAGGTMYISLQPFMHHKFCIIDDNIIINGSYNWSYPARSNEENITVLKMKSGAEGDDRFIKKFVAKYDYLKDKCSQQVRSVIELNSFRPTSKDYAIVLKNYDMQEIQLRKEFENDVLQSIKESKKLGIKVSQYMLERMESDGGGVEFVKRILHDEMSSGEMKSGFTRLEELTPIRIDLSLEYLVAKDQYVSIFTEQERTFCIDIMKRYNLERKNF